MGMSYRGPNPQRIKAQFSVINQHAAETAIWQQYVSASTGTASGYWGGQGTTRYYRDQCVSALLAAPQMGEGRFRETQLPAGQVLAGDAMISLSQRIGSQDQIVWRGTTYRVEGDRVPINLGDRVWWRTILSRGDATG
jgi:hypothetical protein